MVICLERGADLHMVQLMPLPLTVSCFSKIQIGFAFLVPAHSGSPGQMAVKRVCVCACVCVMWYLASIHFILLSDGRCTCLIQFGCVCVSQELMYCRVSYIENPWYDDHFDIPTERQRIGKTLTMITAADATHGSVDVKTFLMVFGHIFYFNVFYCLEVFIVENH